MPEIKTLNLIDQEEAAAIIREVVREEVRRAIEPLLSAVVVQQKDADLIAEVSQRTLSSKIADGDIEVLNRPGSRKNFLTLTTLEGLRPRRRAK